MAQKLVTIHVDDEYIKGGGVSLGGAGGHDAVLLELRFSPVWTGLTKKLLWTDAHGDSAGEVLLTSDRAQSESVYTAPVPAAALAYEGDASLTVKGVFVDTTVTPNVEKLRILTEAAFFRVLPSLYDADSESDIDPTLAEQIQQEVEDALADITDARNAAKDAEAWAVGQRDSVDVGSTDETYHNNSKYYAGQSSDSADASAGSAAAAATSATNASGSATAAASSATAAAGSATAASESATAAAGSATAAAGSATAAASSATAAAGSATAAATSASNAAGSEAAAEDSADYVAEQMLLWNQKADQTTVDLLVKSVSLNASTGVLTFTRENGTTFTIDTVLEKVATNWQYDAETQSLVLTLADGTTQTVPLSAFITETEFTDSEQIAFSVSNHTITATVKSGSITDTMLSSALLGQLQNYVSAAAGSATAAATSAGNAATSETNAAASASAAATSETNAAESESAAEDSAEDAEAWAVGQRDGTDVPSTDDTYHNNAKYWAEQAASAAAGGVASFNGRSGIVSPQSGDYTAAMVGLGNVDNTSDENKPISTATQTALDAKAEPAVTDTITLTAAGWSNNAQTVSNEIFLSSGYAYIISPAPESYEAYNNAGIYALDISTDGEITFQCRETPAVAINVHVQRNEVQS